MLGAHAGDILAAVDLHGARAVVSARRGGTARRRRSTPGLAALPEDADRALVVLGDGPASTRGPSCGWRRPDPERVLAADYGAGRRTPSWFRGRSGARSPATARRRSGRSAPTSSTAATCAAPGDVDYATSS